MATEAVIDRRCHGGGEGRERGTRIDRRCYGGGRPGPDVERGMNAGAVGTQPLAERALSEGFGRLRYRDTSLLIWQQQQQQLERRVLGPGPDSYLGRSQSMWYQRFGNQPVLVRDRARLRGAEDPDTDPGPDTGRSRVCVLM